MFELAVDWTRVLGMIGDIIKGTSNTRRQFAKLRVWMGAYGEELQSNMVCNYSHADKLDLTQLVRADKPSLLARAPHELKLSYTFRGQTHTLQDYLDRNPTFSWLRMTRYAATHLVLVHTAVRLKPTGEAGDKEVVALLHALLQQADAMW